AGADAAAHEHRGVLATADDRPDLLTADEIVEQLRDEWRLVLNVDPETNLDDDGHELGLTPWHCLIRCIAEGDEQARYLETVLIATGLREAEELALDAADESRPKEIEQWEEAAVVVSDRLNEETLTDSLKTRNLPPPVKPWEAGLITQAWLA